MANSVVATVVHDGQFNTVYNLTGILDTSDYAAADFTTISGLNPVPTMLRLDHLAFSIEDGINVRLWWHDNTPTLIMPIAGRSYFNFIPFGGLTNPRNTGWTGNLEVSTQGYTTGIYTFALLLEFKKQFS